MSIYSGAAYSIYRLLPPAVQESLVSAILRRRWRHESGRRFQTLVSMLRSLQRATPEEMAEWRRGRLVRILLAASRTRHYSSLLPREELIRRSPEDVLRDVPPIDRRDVAADPRSFVARTGRGVVRRGTSGTTGSPLSIWWDRESRDFERALVWRQRLAAGCIPGRDWRGMLGGHMIVPVDRSIPPFWKCCRPSREAYLSTYHLSGSNAAAYADFIESRGIRHLEGYPSALLALCTALRDSGRTLSMSAAFFGAEPMNELQRSTIEGTLGCHVWDYYGLTERVVSASEFECGSGLHLNWENCYPEILDPSGGPVGEGEYGELAGTSLSNTAFTLLRYRTGDMTRIIPDPCTCGRCAPRMDPVDSKREDLLILPGGSMLSASNLTFPFKEAKGVRLAQIHQPSEDRVTVRVVPDGAFTDAEAQKLLRRVSELFPSSVSVTLEKVESIPLTRSGKYAFCISEVRQARTPR